MKSARKAEQEQVWWVTHPDHGMAVVCAPCWEQATVEAARQWNVPWRKVAALCECHRTERLARNVCVSCGTIFHGKGLLCPKCRIVEQGRRAQDRKSCQETVGGVRI